jgi:hypothetical protein
MLQMVKVGGSNASSSVPASSVSAFSGAAGTAPLDLDSEHLTVPIGVVKLAVVLAEVMTLKPALAGVTVVPAAAASPASIDARANAPATTSPIHNVLGIVLLLLAGLRHLS